MKFTERIKHAWNVFADDKTRGYGDYYNGPGYTHPHHRLSINRYSSSEFASKVFNRIALDVSMTDFIHVRVDEESGNQEYLKSGLSNCLRVEANIDQSNREFMHDLVYSMFDEGHVAVVAVETDKSLVESSGFDVLQLRVGRVVQWHPKHVRVRLYNDVEGFEDEVTLPKRSVAIIENPLFPIVNGSNSTLKRIVNKMALLDNLDEQRGSKRMNLILQLPYTIKGDVQRAKANERIKDIEAQMNVSQYGVAYVDGTEKITQLNRPLDNNILEEIQYLSEQFYNQMGLTPNVFNGTATELEMKVYYTRTIDPIVERIISELKRKFLTKTARTQGQTIVAYRDPFKLVLTEQIADIGDKFRRNEILTSNEVRKIIGFHPSLDPKADTLSNPNMPNEDSNSGSVSSPDKIKMDTKQVDLNKEEE